MTTSFESRNIGWLGGGASRCHMNLTWKRSRVIKANQIARDRQESPAKMLATQCLNCLSEPEGDGLAGEMRWSRALVFCPSSDSLGEEAASSDV
jgi:hypothetical protein